MDKNLNTSFYIPDENTLSVILGGTFKESSHNAFFQCKLKKPSAWNQMVDLPVNWLLSSAEIIQRSSFIICHIQTDPNSSIHFSYFSRSVEDTVLFTFLMASMKSSIVAGAINSSCGMARISSGVKPWMRLLMDIMAASLRRKGYVLRVYIQGGRTFERWGVTYLQTLVMSAPEYPSRREAIASKSTSPERSTSRKLISRSFLRPSTVNRKTSGNGICRKSAMGTYRWGGECIFASLAFSSKLRQSPMGSWWLPGP